MPNEQIRNEIRNLIDGGAQKLNWFFVFALMSGIILGPGFVAISFFISEDVMAARIFGIVITFLLFGLFIEQALKIRKDQSILSSLDNNFAELAWVYREISVSKSDVFVTEVQVAKFCHVHFGLVDGTRTKTWLSEELSERLIKLISENFKSLTTGYSPEIEKLFKTDPQILKTHPQRDGQILRTTVVTSYSK